MELADVESKVKAILARELSTEVAKIGDDTMVETMPLWDSVKHVDIFFALQDEFGVEFEQDESDEMISYPAIVAVVLKKLGGSAG